MTFLLGVILTALAILFLLTTLALVTSGQLRHPIRDGASLVALLALGMALLAD
jgi:cytochrome bd-type quinol oxidase subunit 2